MLHAISSQISILVAGLQRLEGQQRHPQPPPPPPAPDGQSPLPPPPTSAPPSVPATSVRPTYPTVPITLVATSDNRMEPAGHAHSVSVSTSRERRRRRRFRHRDSRSQLRRRAEPLEYSVWQDQEWVRIYTPGQSQLWQPEEAVPDLPDNLFREWKRVTDPIGGTGEHSQAWTSRDWQHQGYQRILSRFESFSTHQAQDQSLVDVQNSDIIRVEEMFTYAPPYF